MKIPLALPAALLAASALTGAARAAQPPQATVKELADIVRTKGTDDAVGPGVMLPLGLGRVKVATKDLSVDEETSPDHKEHTFDVSDGGLIILTVSWGKDTSEGHYTELHAFNVGQDGKLLSAAQITGIKGNKNKDRKSVPVEVEEDRLKEELQYWRQRLSAR